jgi:hypothetical protein
MMKFSLAFALCSFCFCFDSGVAFAQTGTVQLYFSPENAWVRLNGEVIEPSPERKLPIIRTLPAGTNVLEIWHQGLQLFTDTLKIAAGESLVYRKGIKERDARYDSDVLLERKTRKVHFNDQVNLGGALALTVLFTYQSVAFDLGTGRQKKRLKQLERDYSTAISGQEVENIKLEYAALNTDYLAKQKKRNVVRAVGIPLMLGAGITSYFLYKKTKKSKANVIKAQAKNPFVYRPSLQIDGLSGLQLGFSAQF